MLSPPELLSELSEPPLSLLHEEKKLKKPEPEPEEHESEEQPSLLQLDSLRPFFTAFLIA